MRCLAGGAHEFLQDKDLGSKLNKELPGILNWAIKGCLDWQQQGLNPPQIVLEQVSAYKTEMDSIAQFVEQECDIDREYPRLCVWGSAHAV